MTHLVLERSGEEVITDDSGPEVSRWAVSVLVEICTASQADLCFFHLVSWPLRRNPRPGRRRFNHIRRAPGRQNVRGSVGNDSEHEQSGGLALQQSQEADIGERMKCTADSLFLFPLLLMLSLFFFSLSSEQSAAAVRWRKCVFWPACVSFLKSGGGGEQQTELSHHTSLKWTLITSTVYFLFSLFFNLFRIL